MINFSIVISLVSDYFVKAKRCKKKDETALINSLAVTWTAADARTAGAQGSLSCDIVLLYRLSHNVNVQRRQSICLYCDQSCVKEDTGTHNVIGCWTMLTIPPGAYPIRGFAYLCSHPKLNARVGGFLAGASALCLTGILALAFFTFRAQLRFVGHSLIGVGIAGKLTTCCLILAETSVGVYLVFKHTMQILQRNLFTQVLHGMLSFVWPRPAL